MKWLPRPQRRRQRGRGTIARLWQDAVAANRGAPAYLVERDGEWHEVSWAEAAEGVDELAHGLLSIGIRKGDSFAILGSTTLEWALFDFALGSIGAVAAPIYANSSPGDCAYVLEHSDAVGVLVEDEGQRAKIAGVPLEHVYSFADLDGLRARGRKHASQHPRAVEEAAAQIDEDDLFTFIYTSGTTGPPKGCMIRHRNYYAMCQEAEAANDVLASGDVILLFLPLAHNFGRADPPARALSRVHDCVLPRSAQGRRGAPCRPAHGVPERASPLREDPHRRHGRVRRGNRREAEDRGLGAPRRKAGQRAAPARRADSVRAEGAAPACATSSSTRR